MWFFNSTATPSSISSDYITKLYTTDLTKRNFHYRLHLRKRKMNRSESSCSKRKRSQYQGFICCIDSSSFSTHIQRNQIGLKLETNLNGGRLNAALGGNYSGGCSVYCLDAVINQTHIDTICSTVNADYDSRICRWYMDGKL